MSSVSAAATFRFTREHFNRLRRLAAEHAGFCVSDDKQQMYYARLAKQLRLLGLSCFEQYVELVERDASARSQFINSITTNVTAFEREKHHFQLLKKQCEDASGQYFRVWSAGCSTGQEAYNIAIALLPICVPKGMQLCILASDIDSDALSVAKRGVFAAEQIRVFSESVRCQNFLRGTEHNQYRVKVKPHLQQCVEFKKINLSHDWQLAHRFDAIFCRNVMIYLSHSVREALTKRFHQQLKKDGRLYLGHSESLNQVSDQFVNLGSTVYQPLG